MSEKINVIENAVDFRLGMIMRGMNNVLKIMDKESYTRSIPLHVLMQEIKDDLVMFVGEKKYHIDENDVKRRIEYQVENVLNAVKVRFTDTDMILTIHEVA